MKTDPDSPAHGVRFRLFPEFAEGFREPERVALDAWPGEIRPGPEDRKFYVANARDKRIPYEFPAYVPPYHGSEFPLALPTRAGHFDEIPVESAQFFAAHLFGCARHTLDIWEQYLERDIAWWHAPLYPRLELVPVVEWNNAHSGLGYLETGLMPGPAGELRSFALNFDVVAHEVGHAILFSTVGAPDPDRLGPHFLAFHESFSDLVGLVGCLHFGSVRSKLLEQTQGNLYVLNLVSRIGELSTTEQIRIASNSDTLANVADLRLLPDGKWHDPSGLRRNEHAVAQPLTGAIFDCLVEIYQDRLAALGLIAPDDDVRGWTRADVARSFESLHNAHGYALARFRAGFERAVIEARDLVGLAMAHVMDTVDPNTVTFDRIAARFIERLAQLGVRNLLAFVVHFVARGIDPRPFLVPRSLAAGVTSVCFCDSGLARPRRPIAELEKIVSARQQMRHDHRLNEQHRENV